MKINRKNVRAILKLYILWIVADTVSVLLFLPFILEYGVEDSLMDIAVGWAKALIPPPLNFVLDLETGPEFFVLQLLIFTVLVYWFFFRHGAEENH